MVARVSKSDAIPDWGAIYTEALDQIATRYEECAKHLRETMRARQSVEALPDQQPAPDDEDTQDPDSGPSDEATPSTHRCATGPSNGTSDLRGYRHDLAGFPAPVRDEDLAGMIQPLSRPIPARQIAVFDARYGTTSYPNLWFSVPLPVGKTMTPSEAREYLLALAINGKLHDVLGESRGSLYVPDADAITVYTLPTKRPA